MAKVLIVEDDPLMNRLYQKAFHFEGYEVSTAYNGEEGLKKTKEEKPTLVLLDIMMPKMNGLEYLDELKKHPEVKNTPVIVLTNLADEKDAELALTKGAVRYIIKSNLDPKKIVDIVKQILAGYTRGEIPKSD